MTCWTRHKTASCAKTAEPIEVQFGMWTHWVPSTIKYSKWGPDSPLEGALLGVILGQQQTHRRIKEGARRSCPLTLSLRTSRRGRLVPLEGKKTFLVARAPPGPHWRSLQCSLRPLAGGQECPFSKNPSPLSALWASGFGYSGFAPSSLTCNRKVVSS